MKSTNPLAAVFPDLVKRFPEVELGHRCIGTSTGIAFNTLAQTYKYPGTWVKIVDHFGTHAADRNLLLHIKFLLDKLEYKEFYFREDHSGCFISLGKP